MAIIIGEPSLSCDPTEGTLPFEITLTQTLGSTSPPETATLTYVLKAHNDVFFKAGNAPPTKQLVTTKSVTLAQNQQIADVVTLVQGAGRQVAQVNIDETIVGQSGAAQEDSCLVNITAAKRR
ncbi:MAG: hypothetical protein M3O15_15605 [Acidobacteriota bacterium]|nr:hypothetical protein [Acidobacteriota bacterium]